MRELQVHADASTEAQQAAAWYEGRRKGLGFDFLWEIGTAFLVLGEDLMSGAPWPEQSLAARGVRRISLKKFPYHVVFIEEKAKAIVLAIAHLRRRPGYWQSRLTP